MQNDRFPTGPEVGWSQHVGRFRGISIRSRRLTGATSLGRTFAFRSERGRVRNRGAKRSSNAFATTTEGPRSRIWRKPSSVTLGSRSLQTTAKVRKFPWGGGTDRRRQEMGQSLESQYGLRED